MNWIAGAYRPRLTEHRRALPLGALSVLVWLRWLESRRSRTVTGGTVWNGVS